MTTGTSHNRSGLITAVHSFLVRLFSRAEQDNNEQLKSVQAQESHLIESRIKALQDELKDIEQERLLLENLSVDTQHFAVALTDKATSTIINRFEGREWEDVPLMMKLKDDLLRRHEIRLQKVETRAVELIQEIRGLIAQGLLPNAREILNTLNEIIIEVESTDIREAFKDTILLWNKERHKSEAEIICSAAHKKRIERESSTTQNSNHNDTNQPMTSAGSDSNRQNKYDALLDLIRKKQAVIAPIRDELSRIRISKGPHYRAIQNQLKRMNVSCLYHYTDRRNITSINKYGGVLSYRFMAEHGIDIPAPTGDNRTHNVDKDLHTDDYVKLLLAIDHNAITQLKQTHDIMLLKIDTEVAGALGNLFAPTQALINENQITDDYRFLNKDVNQVMILAKTFIPKKYIIEVIKC